MDERYNTTKILQGDSVMEEVDSTGIVKRYFAMTVICSK